MKGFGGECEAIVAHFSWVSLAMTPRYSSGIDEIGDVCASKYSLSATKPR
jgi:hypothetical protein